MTTATNNMTSPKKSLTIAVVSTIEHCRTLTTVLKARGHRVLSLPDLGNKQRLPVTADVIVCRVLGSSHAATAICFEENRRGTRPVIFRNGTTSIVQQIQMIEQGTWAPDWRLMSDSNAAQTQLETDPEEQTWEQLAEVARQEQVATCRAGILAMLEKGNIFATALTQLNNLERAKDVVCRVSYDTRDRVKRTAVIDAMRVFKQKPAFIDEQVDFVTSTNDVHTYEMYALTGKEVAVERILAKEPLTRAQLDQFLKALNEFSKKATYSIERPVIQEDHEAVPDVQVSEPSPVVEQTPVMVEPIKVAPVVVEVALPPEPEITLAAEPAVVIPEDVRKHLLDALEMVSSLMDSAKLVNLPTELLQMTGLSFGRSGMLELTTVHMDSPNGVCCQSGGARVTSSVFATTCPACKKTEIFKVMNWYATQNQSAVN